MKVLGISGSPTKNSNTDTLIKTILEATGAETEFVKLSDIKVGPCIACMKCVCTNECILNDDFKWPSRRRHGDSWEHDCKRNAMLFCLRSW